MYKRQELTRRIRGLLEGTFLDVWVRGEISNFRKPVSGHAYFILKDATSQLRVVMFRHNLSKHKFQIQDGMEILLHGSITVYEARGDYQLVADSIEPVGMGALQLAFEQLKGRLQKEGLFDPKHKKLLPLLPKRVGIVTSSTGAAVKDILKVLARRFFNLEILILPTSVQGEKAAGEICLAIDFAETWNRQYPERALDVLIVGRGGGSIEDLWPFNEEIVARRIFACSLPVISAVGHEIDFTIADFVADVRAPTPSAAAEMVTQNKAELVERVKVFLGRIIQSVEGRIREHRLHVGHLSQRLKDPRDRIRKLHERFQISLETLTRVIKNRNAISRQKLQNSVQLLDSLSPLQVLGRGYSITATEQGQILRSAINIVPRSIICTRFSDGTIRSEVLP